MGFLKVPFEHILLKVHLLPFFETVTSNQTQSTDNNETMLSG